MTPNTNRNFALGCLGFTCICIVFLMLGYFVVAGLTYLVCLGFQLEWSWLLALGVYALIGLFAILAKVI